jgi:peptide-methionine (S)-S-oxide reductase
VQNRSWWLAVAGVLVAAAAVALAGRWLWPETLARPGPSGLARSPDAPPPAGFQQATFGSSCFWCTQAVFQQLNGVHSTVSGYSGGSVKDPTYDQVCRGTTGHAEVVQVSFDPKVISYPELLEVFWKTHDPTTLNRQGPDSGTQYRSVIFHHTPEQQQLAERYKRKLDASGAFEAPIVTTIEPFSAFYPAEKYHQNYYMDNPRQGYCTMIIGPKLQKFARAFEDKLKPRQGDAR